MATITVTCGTGISGVAWRQYNSSGAQIDSGTFGGTKSWTASSGYLMIYPNRESGYSHPIYYTRTDGYVQTITNSDGSDNDRQISFTQNKTGTVTATYHAPSTYIISYDANGGAGAPSAQTKTHGVNLTLSSTKPSRTGYDFLYWQDQGTDYSIWHPGDSFDRDRNTTLKAIWKRKTYTVSYNANGGTGAPAAQTKYYGENLILTTDEPTRTGYNFVNWYDGTDYYSPGGVYTANSPATLYAQWELKKYTVSFDANGGTGAPSAQTKYYNVDLTLSSVKPTHASTTPSPASYTVTLNSNGGSAVSSPLTANRRTEYTFANWNTNAGGGGTAYSPGGTYSANESAILCAIWNWATITDEVTLPTPTRSLYTFMGWAEDASASSGVKGSYRPTKNVTLYAIWKQNKYTVEYRSNGGIFSDGTTSKSIDPVVPNEHIDLANYSVSRSGYVFAGWCLNSDPIGHTVYPPGYEYEVIGNTVFYAAWKITLTYMANGQLYATEHRFPGERFTMSQSVSGGTYYSFGGWRYAGQAIQPGTTTSFSSNATLTAILTMQLYYWFGSDAADSSYFARGQPVTSALSASAWNRMIMHTYELRELLGQSAITISGVSSGDPVTADAFNRLRSLISRTTGAGTLPGAVSQGDEITTGLFNGSGSLKGALNTAIDAYNNS